MPLTVQCETDWLEVIIIVRGKFIVFTCRNKLRRRSLNVYLDVRQDPEEAINRCETMRMVSSLLFWSSLHRSQKICQHWFAYRMFDADVTTWKRIFSYANLHFRLYSNWKRSDVKRVKALRLFEFVDKNAKLYDRDRVVGCCAMQISEFHKTSLQIYELLISCLISIISMEFLPLRRDYRDCRQSRVVCFQFSRN